MIGRTLLLTVIVLCSTFGAGAALSQTFIGSTTQDRWCDLSPSPCGVFCADSSSFTLTISDAIPAATGDATITLDFLADVDNPTDENLAVSVEGFSMGKITNSVTTDDKFNHPTDSVSDCTPVSMSGSIPLASLEAILSDSDIKVTFTPEQEINNINANGCPDPRETMTVSVEYPIEGAPVPTVPAGALVLLAFALGSVGVYLSRCR